jgi:hypothetical protein
MPRRRTSARGWAVAALLASAATLTACEEDIGGESVQRPDPVAEPTVDVDQAQQTYHPLVAAVAEAVAEVSVPGRADDRYSETIYYASDLESCVYSSLRYEFDTVFGDGGSASWDEVRAAMEPVVEPEGFELTEQLDIPGGHNGFEARTDYGAYFKVTSKLGQPSTISLDAPVLGSCNNEVSETLPPLPS